MATALYGIVLLGLIIYGLQLLAVRKAVASASEKEGTLPPVSILKPLKGLDDNLFDNLSSFCEQDYGDYEIIFCLQERNDPAHKVVRMIRERYPERDISVIVHDYEGGLNPKVNNLVPAYQAAKHDLILISDSNVMVDRDYLKEITRQMEDPQVGLVTNPIRGTGERTLGSLFENLHMNSFVIGSSCLLDRFLKIPCVIGKSMLMRKSDLEAIGGLSGVKDFLAEDYIIGRRINRLGKRVVLSGHVINNINEYWGFRKFLNRHTRWGKLRWKIGGPAYLSELLLNPVFIAFVGLVSGIEARSAALLASASLIKIGGDLTLGRWLRSGAHPLLYLFSPLKDIMVGFIWFVPILSNTVTWRGNRYLIGKDSLLSPCNSAPLSLSPLRLMGVLRTRFAARAVSVSE